MKTAKLRDVDGGTYWIAFFDEVKDGKRVSLSQGIGETEKKAIASLVAKEKAKKTAAKKQPKA